MSNRSDVGAATAFVNSMAVGIRIGVYAAVRPELMLARAHIMLRFRALEWLCCIPVRPPCPDVAPASQHMKYW